MGWTLQEFSFRNGRGSSELAVCTVPVLINCILSTLLHTYLLSGVMLGDFGFGWPPPPLLAPVWRSLSLNYFIYSNLFKSDAFYLPTIFQSIGCCSVAFPKIQYISAIWGSPVTAPPGIAGVTLPMWRHWSHGWVDRKRLHRLSWAELLLTL